MYELHIFGYLLFLLFVNPSEDMNKHSLADLFIRTIDSVNMYFIILLSVSMNLFGCEKSKHFTITHLQNKNIITQ